MDQAGASAASTDTGHKPDKPINPEQSSPTAGRKAGQKRKSDTAEPQSQAPTPDPATTAPGEPVHPSKRKRREERFQRRKRGGHTPPAAYSRREPASQPQREPSPPRSPSPIRRSPSPSSAAAAPPRPRKRPGGGARVGQAGIELVRRRQAEREWAEAERERESATWVAARGVEDVVRQHYNAVPERGREWRRTDSKIRGLRSFNNWVKSVLIHKFSPDEQFLEAAAAAAATTENNGVSEGDPDWAGRRAEAEGGQQRRLLVVDLGCGKGGDLGKWQQAPQPVDIYIGLDAAEVSVEQARERYASIRSRSRRGRGGDPGSRIFRGEFLAMDCFAQWLGAVPLVRQVGIDANVGPDASAMASRWGNGGGFDVVAAMFTMHYAFETEAKARMLLTNVAGALRRGGRFVGVGPNSDTLSENVIAFYRRKAEKEKQAESQPEEEREDGEVEGDPDEDPPGPTWGNSIYRVRFPGPAPADGVFRPAFGWKYSYFLEEAVEGVPEYVVPWEAFRALVEEYDLELQYRRPFVDVWRDEQSDPVLGPLAERMGVRGRGSGPLLVSDEEMEAASFYHAFCFYKL